MTSPAPSSCGRRTARCYVERPDDERQNRALHGLTRSLVNNMVVGVTDGFSKDLEIVGVGYRATPQGDRTIELALGFSHPVKIEAPDGITFEVPAPTRVTVRGIDKEKVGQVAADIRAIRKPEPYKGKGVRYAGERVQRKAGKAGASRQGRDHQGDVMTMSAQTKRTARIRRHRRVRKQVQGTAERPRLAVFRSNKHLVMQVIDDGAGRTLAAASTIEAGVKSEGSTGNTVAAARVGKLVAERAKAAGVTKVVFDRGGFLYHGRVAAAADAAREAGLEF